MQLVYYLMISILFLISNQPTLWAMENPQKHEARFLYYDAKGNLSIKTATEAVEAGIDELFLEKKESTKASSRITLVKDDKTLLLKLIDKYFYKKTRHLKYERDMSLGKDDKHTVAEMRRSTRNLRILREAIVYVGSKLAQKTAAAKTDAQRDGILKRYLQEKQKKQQRYFGSDWSDDSDEEDEQKYVSRKKKNTKNETAHNILSKPHMKKIAQSLETKLAALVQRHQEEEITSEFILDSLDGRRKTKTQTGITSLAKLTILNDLITRASLIDAADEIDEQVKQDMEAVNALIKRKGFLDLDELKRLQATGKVKTKFFIAQYRGVNYMIDRWSADARRYHRTMSEENLPHYSEAVLRTLPYCFFTELDADHDFTKDKADRTHLLAQAVRLKKLMNWLNQSGYCVDFSDEAAKNPYLFNSIADCFQHRFSNGINEHLERLQQLREQHPDFWGKLFPSALNNAVAAGGKPYHSLKYTHSLKKYYHNPFYPRYHSDGTLEYLHAGKVYISLHDLEELFGHERPNCVSQMDRQAQVALQYEIAPEKETSFVSFIPADNIFYHYVAKYPSLQGDFKDRAHVLATKYGLSESLYNSFQYLISISEPGSELRKAVIKLLSEWLCAYHEVRLIEIAKQEAQKRGGVLAYLDRDGYLSFVPDNGRMQTGGDNNMPLRNTAHILRELRRNLGDNYHDTNVVDNESFPGFSVIKELPLGDHQKKILRSGKDQLKLATHVAMSKRQEGEIAAKETTEEKIKKEEVKRVIKSDYATSFVKRAMQSCCILSQLTDAEHLYEETEINTLLRSYLQEQNGDFVARILGAVHPFIRGATQEQARTDFANRLRAAFTPGVPVVIPINLTQEVVNEYQDEDMPGTHWVGLIIRQQGNNHYQIEYVDSMISPEEDTDVDDLEDLETHHTLLHELTKSIRVIAQERGITVAITILGTDQQTGDVDCGAWLVDNLVRRAEGQQLRTNIQITGAALRLQHAQLNGLRLNAFGMNSL
jgi:hypothetical protein